MNRDYEIIGDPIPLARHRVSYDARCTYDPQKVIKKAIMQEILAQNNPRVLYEGPCSLEVTFYIKMPASWSVKRKELNNGLYHTGKPDTDNLVKFISDVIQLRDDSNKSILIHDDCLISFIIAKKVWSYQPRTIFTITELK